MGENEINLVRKKLKWKHEPFKIPSEILDEWKKIGSKGIKEEEKWKKNYNKKKTLVEKTFKNEIHIIGGNKVKNQKEA